MLSYDFFPFMISIENGNFRYHSNHTGSAAIYSREISREWLRMTLQYHMSGNQRLIANMVSCLFHSKFIRNQAENNGKKTDQ